MMNAALLQPLLQRDGRSSSFSAVTSLSADLSAVSPGIQRPPSTAFSAAPSLSTISTCASTDALPLCDGLDTRSGSMLATSRRPHPACTTLTATASSSALDDDDAVVDYPLTGRNVLVRFEPLPLPCENGVVASYGPQLLERTIERLFRANRMSYSCVGAVSGPTPAGCIPPSGYQLATNRNRQQPGMRTMAYGAHGGVAGFPHTGRKEPVAHLHRQQQHQQQQHQQQQQGIQDPNNVAGMENVRSHAGVPSHAIVVDLKQSPIKADWARRGDCSFSPSCSCLACVASAQSLTASSDGFGVDNGVVQKLGTGAVVVPGFAGRGSVNGVAGGGGDMWTHGMVVLISLIVIVTAFLYWRHFIL